MDKVRRIFVEKKPEFATEAKLLLKEFKEFVGIEELEAVRIIHRYDIEGISEETYDQTKETIFYDPVVDILYNEDYFLGKECKYFIVEYLPGQYNQKADFIAQCLQVTALGNRPEVRTAEIIILDGHIGDEGFKKIKDYYINPVEMKEADLEKPKTLKEMIVEAKKVQILENFIENHSDFYLDSLGLAMSKEDLEFCRDYFKNIEKRNPTITEIKVIDTYWSDHCRHTTFNTIIDKVTIEDSPYKGDLDKSFQKYKKARNFVYKEKQNEMCLMDLALIAMKEMRKRGDLDDLEVSDEINAASIEIDVEIDGNPEKYLIMFKNETHNHPTEIEPFGGAATCLGGAIRDPLSGRSYVFAAMRITGSGDPRTSINKTLAGKLPQRKITTTAAAGYSSYGSQIGIAAGQVAEIYHEGFLAKRMELGAVVAAAPKENVVRERPIPGDLVILLGGRTGRDGCGGATGSSKGHDEESAIKSGAEVQKGNAAIEGYIQKLFRKPEVSKMIKKCNDFGAGGVSVAVGELADSLYIDLDKVPVKYKGLDGTELAISESQERMAVVVSSKDKEKFIELANKDNLEATVIAEITDNGRLIMNWQSNNIVNLRRDFLDSNGIRQRTNIYVESPKDDKEFFKDIGIDDKDIKTYWLNNLKQLNICSQKGLVESFDSSAGGNTVLMPYGGKYQDTPSEGLLMKLPLLKGNTNTAVAMTYGYSPYLMDWSPYHGGIYSLIQAISKIVALGGDYKKVRLTMQEYFERLGTDEKKWGKAFAALLGAYEVQKELNLPAIGGKDSMSGTFMDLHVPPTLVSFALTAMDVSNGISQEFKKPNNKIIFLPIRKDSKHMPDFEYLKGLYERINNLIKEGIVFSSSTVKEGGIAAELSKMCFGNKIGISLTDNIETKELFSPNLASFILEVGKDFDNKNLDDLDYILLGKTINEEVIRIKDLTIPLEEASRAWSETLEEVFPTKTYDKESPSLKEYNLRNLKKGKLSFGKPKVLIPVFPGCNSEYELARSFEKANAIVKILIIRNISKEDIMDSIKELAEEVSKAQILAISGSFTGGNEPYGAANLIASVLKNKIIFESLENFLNNKDGLILGINNGFQGLLKTGLLPYGHMRDMDENSPSLTTNKSGRHVSKMADIRITSVLSPWMANCEIGDIYTLPISHREGRFVAKDSIIKELESKGQIVAQYEYSNPNASICNIESISSPDGRILGKMAHSERKGRFIGINVPGNKEQEIFKAGVDYFK